MEPREDRPARNRYKDEPAVAAFDLLNEPISGNDESIRKYKDQLVPVYKRLISAIREVDQKHMITVEGYEWANDWSLFDKPLDDNIFYQFHYYCWDRPDKLKNIDYYLEKQDQLNVPVWVGETGEKGNAIYFGTAQYFEKNNIGWSFWPWKKMDTRNTPYSIRKPLGWNEVVAFTEGGKQPSREESMEIFAQLAENIKLENCVYYPDVVNAMMCRVPLKIEAENYSWDGSGTSYSVKDTTFRSENYRTWESVPIILVSFDKDKLTSEQAIKLEEGEWTDYLFESLENVSYQFTLKLKPLNPNTELELQLNGESMTVVADGPEWLEKQLGSQFFLKGKNKIKLFVKSGSVKVDWINIY